MAPGAVRISANTSMPVRKAFTIFPIFVPKWRIFSSPFLPARRRLGQNAPELIRGAETHWMILLLMIFTESEEGVRKRKDEIQGRDDGNAWTLDLLHPDSSFSSVPRLGPSSIRFSFFFLTDLRDSSRSCLEQAPDFHALASRPLT